MVDSSIYEMALEMLEPVEELFGAKDAMNSKEFISEKEKVFKKFSSKGENSSIAARNFSIGMDEAISMLKSMGYTPAKYGGSSSYGMSVDSLNMYKPLKTVDGYIVVYLMRDESITRLKDPRVNVSITYSRKQLSI